MNSKIIKIELGDIINISFLDFENKNNLFFKGEFIGIDNLKNNNFFTPKYNDHSSYECCLCLYNNYSKTLLMIPVLGSVREEKNKFFFIRIKSNKIFVCQEDENKNKTYGYLYFNKIIKQRNIIIEKTKKTKENHKVNMKINRPFLLNGTIMRFKRFYYNEELYNFKDFINFKFISFSTYCLNCFLSGDKCDKHDYHKTMDYFKKMEILKEVIINEDGNFVDENGNRINDKNGLLINKDEIFYDFI